MVQGERGARRLRHATWNSHVISGSHCGTEDHDESAPSLQDGAESALLTPDLIEEVSATAFC